MDISIKQKNFEFKVRTSGLIINDGKLLICKLDTAEHYCLPGGHCHINETSPEAIKREIKEETGLDVKIDCLSALLENIYSTKKARMHEINFFYKLTPTDLPKEKQTDWNFVELDEGEYKHQEFKWIDIKDFDNYDIRPSIIKDLIHNNKLLHIEMVDNIPTFLN